MISGTLKIQEGPVQNVRQKSPLDNNGSIKTELVIIGLTNLSIKRFKNDKHDVFCQGLYFSHKHVCLFVLMLYVPINNLRVFVGSFSCLPGLNQY